MKIEGEDFLMEYDEGCNKFDLSIMYVKNAKNPEKRSEELKLYGYGMTMESCIRKIINYRLSKTKDIYSLQEYIKEYRKEIDKIHNLIKLL